MGYWKIIWCGKIFFIERLAGPDFFNDHPGAVGRFIRIANS